MSGDKARETQQKRMSPRSRIARRTTRRYSVRAPLAKRLKTARRETAETPQPTVSNSTVGEAPPAVGTSSAAPIDVQPAPAGSAEVIDLSDSDSDESFGTIRWVIDTSLLQHSPPGRTSPSFFDFLDGVFSGTSRGRFPSVSFGRFGGVGDELEKVHRLMARFSVDMAEAMGALATVGNDEDAATALLASREEEKIQEKNDAMLELAIEESKV